MQSLVLEWIEYGPDRGFSRGLLRSLGLLGFFGGGFVPVRGWRFRSPNGTSLRLLATLEGFRLVGEGKTLGKLDYRDAAPTGVQTIFPFPRTFPPEAHSELVRFLVAGLIRSGDKNALAKLPAKHAERALGWLVMGEVWSEVLRLGWRPVLRIDWIGAGLLVLFLAGFGAALAGYGKALFPILVVTGLSLVLRMFWLQYVRPRPLAVRNAEGQRAFVADRVEGGIYTLTVRRPGRAKTEGRFRIDEILDGLDLREPAGLRSFVAGYLPSVPG